MIVLGSLSESSFSYETHVHSYIVQQAYSLLKHYYPQVENTELKTQLGGPFDHGSHQWETGLITTGAIREDLDDVVYGYGPPNEWYSPLSFLFQSSLTPTVTHFWIADNGDNSKVWIPATLAIDRQFENAFMKLQMYMNGGWKLLYLPEGGQYIKEYKYTSLTQLAKTGQILQTGYYSIVGDHTTLNPPLQVNLTDVNRKRFVYEILGRMCHLIEDMCVPAHVHGDAHPPTDKDYYEEDMDRNYYKWTWENALQQGGIIYPNLQDDPIRYFSYSANQISDIFRSNDYEGNIYLPNGTYPIISEYYNQLGNQPINVIDKSQIANTCLVYAIRATAGFLYWFCDKTDLLKTITILSNGSKYFDLKNHNDQNPQWLTKTTPYPIPFDNNITIDLSGDANNYQYAWGGWQKRDRDNNIVGLNYNVEWLSTSSNATSYYLAQYDYFINITFNEPLLIDGGTGAYYKNLQSEQISNSFIIFANIPTQIQAIAPSGYDFLEWNDHNSTNPRTFYASTNSNGLYAIFKKHLASNSLSALSSNSQRKFISDVNGNKHLVYDSQGSVWYTKSTDNGAAWLPEVKINENGTQAKGATMATSTDGNLYVLYQCDRGLRTNTNPTLVLSQYYYGTLRWQTEVCDLSSYTYNTMPVISAINGVVLVVYKPSATTGLVGVEYYLNSGNIAETHVSNISGTTAYSSNPSLATTNMSTASTHMLVYEQSGIYYTEWAVASDFYGLVTSNISSGSGYTWNYNPSIIELNGLAKVVWIGKRVILPPENLAKVEGENGTAIVTNYEYRTIFKDPSYYRYWSFGSNVSSAPSINKTDNNSAYVFGWSETNGTRTNKFADNTLSTITTLNTTGKDLQLCNGADKYSMFALSFTNAALPYSFALSNSIGSVALAKENTSLSINKGREGVVVKDSSQIYFTLGDVLVNGENISFKTIPDTFSVTSVADVNNCVKTNPFSVTDNSSLFYSVQYGVSNAEQLKRTFTESDIISFRIELVEAATETVLGLFDNISYTKQNAVSYDNFSYEVSTEGIGNKTVYLRLVTTASEGCSFSITDKLDNQSIIAKRYVKQVAFKSAQVIKDYALAQNYPNPFNPVTTITYQLPKSGSVTLKIYDMLGKEVKTLVNEQKEMGRYTVQFDASSLASGMYVYQLRANDYTSTKKMMLLK